MVDLEKYLKRELSIGYRRCRVVDSEKCLKQEPNPVRFKALWGNDCFQTVFQWSSLSIFIVFYSAIVLGAWDRFGGGVVAAALAATVGPMMGGYGWKIRRSLAKVRYRKGMYQKTGDGGEDAWTVLLEKGWISFLRRPVEHLCKPFVAVELKVDATGEYKGSVRLNERPISVLAGHEKFVESIGSNDHAPDHTAELYYSLEDELEDLYGHASGMLCTRNSCYSPEENSEDFGREKFYKLLGLRILKMDGLQM